MDTDTEIYEKFGTMTGPDVLIMSRTWCDEDPARARSFMKAYWESVARVKQSPIAALDLIYEKYFKQDREVLERNLEKFRWLTLEDQKAAMSDEGLFAQTEYVLDVLKDEMGEIETIPDFRKQVNLLGLTSGKMD